MFAMTLILCVKLHLRDGRTDRRREVGGVCPSVRPLDGSLTLSTQTFKLSITQHRLVQLGP